MKKFIKWHDGHWHPFDDKGWVNVKESFKDNEILKELAVGALITIVCPGVPDCTKLSEGDKE